MKKQLFIFGLLVLVTACASNVPIDKNNGDDLSLRIVRDNFGTAHVYADSVYTLFYGYGYAVAQDRLFQMEMARRSTQGTVAEVLGEEFVQFDTQTRHLYSPSSIKKQLAALDKEDLDVFEGYAAGINHWLRMVDAQPEEFLPLEFTEHNFQPEAWSSYDVAMIFVGTMVNRFGDYNTELENAQIVRTLSELHNEETAKKIFDDLNPRYTTNTPTSISSKDWQALNSIGSFESSSANSSYRTYFDASHGSSGFSNCYVLGPDKVQDANAILVNGPQFGWYVPAYTYSIGLHGAGFDLVGNTPFAYPAVIFGHNADITWGSTWGAGDIVDLFEHKLNPENSEQYLYQDQYRDFELRTDTVKVLNSADILVTIRRSVHGQIIQFDADQGVAISKRRVWDGKELDSLLAWMHSTRASNTKEWLAWAEKMSLNINWYYADRSGDIAYAFTGHYPQRHEQHDNRLPAIGDGSMDWQGTQDFVSNNPHATNPESGYIANWNNKPADGVLNPDEFWYSWSTADRVDYLHEQIDSKPRFTSDQAWALVESSSFADINAKYFLPLIDAAAKQSPDIRVKQINDLLQQWNRYSRDEDRDGYFDTAATLIFRTLLQQLVKDVLADDLGDAYNWFATTGYPEPGKPTGSGLNISASLKALVETLNQRGKYDFLNGQSAAEVINKSILSVVETLSAEQGDEMSTWRLANAPRPFTHKNFMGIPQTIERAAMQSSLEQNRGTENNMTVLSADRIVAYEVVPPGNSGFIKQNGDRSEHFDDQFELYDSFGRKRMWFYADDVENNKAASEIIQIQQ